MLTFSESLVGEELKGLVTAKTFVLPPHVQKCKL